MGGGQSHQPEPTATASPLARGGGVQRPTANDPVPIPPYTAYSVNRPVSDSPVSARLKVTDGSPAASSSPSRRAMGGGTAPTPIITVSEGIQHVPDPTTDEDIFKISDIPFVKPLIPGSVSLPESDDSNGIDHLDPRGVLKICARYQQYVRKTSEQMSTNQHKLVSRVKNINTAVTILQTQLTDRQKKFQKYVNHFQKLDDISASLDRTAAAIQEVESLLDILNNVLPDSERLENLTRLG